MPPAMGLMFENEEAARAIFGRWRERFGQVDRDDAIYVSIIKDVSDAHPLHYTALITSNPSGMAKGGGAMVLARFHRMEATTDAYVRRFLAEFETAGVYLLMPAILKGDEPTPLFELAILKRNLAVKSAKTIGPNDIERCTMGAGANAHFEADERSA